MATRDVGRMKVETLRAEMAKARELLRSVDDYETPRLAQILREHAARCEDLADRLDLAKAGGVSRDYGMPRVRRA